MLITYHDQHFFRKPLGFSNWDVWNDWSLCRDTTLYRNVGRYLSGVTA